MGRSFRETIAAKLRQAYKPKAAPRAGAAFCFVSLSRAAAPQDGHRPTENRDGKTAFRERKNRKLIFSVFYPHGRKEKKQGTYFKIRALYFKISQTYFETPPKPHENPPGKYRQRQITFQPASDHAFSCRPHASPRGKNILTKPTHIARRALTGCMLRLHIQLCKHLNFFLFLVAC